MNLRKSLAKKLKKTGGFTLIEMLIVVAIIAILVAVSIPMVNGALDKARAAADDANLRAAKSVAVIAEMYGTLDGTEGGTDITASTTYYYDIGDGVLKTGTPNATSDKDCFGQSNTKKTMYIQVSFGANKELTSVAWGT